MPGCGPSAAAPGAYLWHGQFLSKDRTWWALAEMFGCAPSPAGLAAMASRLAGAVRPVVKAITSALASSEVAYFDEAGFRVAGSWLGALSIFSPQASSGYRCRLT
jgi:transposase